MSGTCVLAIARTTVGALPGQAPARTLYAGLAEHMTGRLDEERLDDAELEHRLR